MPVSSVCRNLNEIACQNMSPGELAEPWGECVCVCVTKCRGTAARRTRAETRNVYSGGREQKWAHKIKKIILQSTHYAIEMRLRAEKGRDQVIWFRNEGQNNLIFRCFVLISRSFLFEYFKLPYSCYLVALAF